MAFDGWPAEALDFYAGLEDDNSKEYWTRRKAVYQEKILRPMEELLEELAPEFGEPKIFRPYRDIRFSHDKTPYKTHIGATLGPTCYVQLSAGGVSPGGGRRAGRRGTGRDRRHPGQGRGRGARARNAQVRTARVSGRSPADRPAQAQGADHVAALDPRALALDCGTRGKTKGILPNECGPLRLAHLARGTLVRIVGELGPDAEEADRAARGEHGQGSLGGSFERGAPPLAVIPWPAVCLRAVQGQLPAGGQVGARWQSLIGGQRSAVGDRDEGGVPDLDHDPRDRAVGDLGGDLPGQAGDLRRDLGPVRQVLLVGDLAAVRARHVRRRVDL